MPEEVSPESKLYVKEEIEKSREEIREEVDKVKSKVTKTFGTVVVVVGLLTGLGVYGSAKLYIKTTIHNKLGAEALDKFERDKQKAERNMVAVEGLLEEISDIEKIANLPIGTIISSMLDPKSFPAAVGERPGSDPVESKWVLADGRDVTESRYGKLLLSNDTSSNTVSAPDLRGMFLRGMNAGRKDGMQDPDKRKAGHPQPDALQKHGHATSATALGWDKGEQGYTQGGYSVPASVTTVEGAKTAKETRPKNVAVYFYIKIN